MAKEKIEWDVFISHASEDKEKFVIPLANKLKEYGVKVWLDKFTLNAGDSLRQSIDEGLKKSKYGIVVLSKSFFSKDWTGYELDSLVNRQVGGRKVILPVWYNITKKAVQKYSLYLADKVALNSNDMDFNEITESLIKVIRPDIYDIIVNLHRTEKMYELGEIKNATSSGIHMWMSEIMKNKANQKHKELSLDILIPLRLIHSIYKDTDKRTFEERIEIYKYNTNLQREILIEIKNATIFLEKTNGKNYDINKRRIILSVINALSFDRELKYENLIKMNLTNEEFKDIKDSFDNFNPNMDMINSGMIFITKNN